MAGWVNIHKG